MSAYLLGIDQGTTSTRAAIFAENGQLIAQHQMEFPQYFPHEGWVEHDPETIWNITLNCCREVLVKTNLTGKQITALGISNQRETTVVWDRKTGKAIYPAIVWQDRRTASQCVNASQSLQEMITRKTGLILDPYFSATKIAWILNHVPQAQALAQQRALAFGTIDTFLVWRFTQGSRHVTDATNASRTLLFNIHTQQWDDELLEYFSIPKSLLPEVLDCNAHFGTVSSEFFGHEIPITGIAGDQQAAMIGQACTAAGMIKSTYGTGCFLVLNTGSNAIFSQHHLISTVGYRINHQVTYALEGSIFIAGAAIQWLRDALHFFKKSSESEQLAAQVENTDGVYFVPAFTGLGAPHWDPLARGAILGLTRATRIEHIVRAALESVCYQTADLIDAVQKDYQQKIISLRVDGGMVANSWLLQFLADLLNIAIERPSCIESSVRGAAWLAGLGVGIYSSLQDLTALWQTEKTFFPQASPEKMTHLYQDWLKAVNRVKT